MLTTTLRLSEELKERIARIALRTGKTPHALMLEAIAERAEREEQRAALVDGAEERFARILESGQTVPWSQMREYLQQKVAGRKVARPKPRRVR